MTEKPPLAARAGLLVIGLLISCFVAWAAIAEVDEIARGEGKVIPVSKTQIIQSSEPGIVREIAVWDGNPEQQYSSEELRSILDKAIASLKPTFRTVFLLRDVEDLSTEETAAALDISVPAVKSRLLRARLELRERLTRIFKKKGDDVFAYL